MRIALCQMKVHNDKDRNLEKAEEMIRRAYEKDTDIVILPEMFNCPYDNSYFREYSESPKDGKTTNRISKLAKELEIYIIAGSIPELDENDNVYNTSFVYDRKGNMIAKHRKVHLFDIDVEGGVTFKESDVLTAGDKPTVFNTEFCKIGLQICYDIRFPELSRMMVKEGAKIIITPGAFNMTTGPSHWESLFKIRALDNQVYTLGCSPAQNEEASYNSYGHSIVVDPWGEVIDSLGFEEGLIIEEINLNKIDNIRQQLPLLKHRRLDIYN